MQLNPHLSFNGQCEEAFKFYQQCLGGNIQIMMKHGDSPIGDQVPSEWRDKILHVTLIVGGTALMGADVPPDHYQKPTGFSVTIQLNEPADAERIFRSLSESGTVTMSLQQTFWATRFGMVVDRFGIPWMVNCGQDS
ncbi:MAG TPA: VOC family protein [Blastocatellia bacterium]|jgi:PhnB protein|nr:VOC family protein [Blastocatellia bacterium]